MISEEGLRDLLRRSDQEGCDPWLEPTALALLEALAIPAPEWRFVAVDDARSLERTAALPGERVVVKAVVRGLAHKARAGGVAAIENRPDAVARALAAMRERFAAEALVGWTLHEHVEHGTGPGGEVLVGLRWTTDFGYVVAVGPGGRDAETVAAAAAPGRDCLLASATTGPGDAWDAAVDRVLALRLLDPGSRAPVREVAERLAALGRALPAGALDAVEINPLAPAPTGALALDVLVRRGPGPGPRRAARPLARLGRLLEPRSVAVVGVSRGRNPGRMIVENLLAGGFPPAALRIVKPDADELCGCRCVPSVAALADPVDLLVVAVGAAEAAELVGEAIAHARAESIVLVPGGLGETPDSVAIETRIRTAIESSRATDWGGPVVNGGNCIGVASLPGRLDATFIPGYKLRPEPAAAAPLAVVSQSGAFAVSLASKLPGVVPRYTVSVGNQIDLTVADYLEHLARDDAVHTVAVYVEGFQPGDGIRFLRAAERFVRSGRTVLLYRAARTRAGTAASASHTASIAGDYAVTRELCRAAGVVVADTLDQLAELVTLHVALDGRPPRGRRLAAVSNAGYECVALADRLGPLELARLVPATADRLRALLERAGVGGVVEPHNPLDLTPMVGDAPFAEAVRLVLDDGSVDVAVVGCVPLTPALRTLPPRADHREDVASDAGVAARLAAVFASTAKPWVAVVDAGPDYDPFAARLARAGIPTFRSADRAVAALGAWVEHRLRCGERLPPPHAEAVTLES